MDVKVRFATPEDAEAITQLNQELARETESTELDAEVLRAGVDGVLADSTRGRYFLADCGGEVVGQAMLTYEWSDWRNGMIVWIQSVFVRAEHRRRGVFRKMYQHMEQICRAEPQVVGMRLYVEEDNSLAKRTYQDLGFGYAQYHVFQKWF